LITPPKEGEIYPQEVLIALRDLAQDAYITTDVGQHQMWAAQYLRMDQDNGLVALGLEQWVLECPLQWELKLLYLRSK